MGVLYIMVSNTVFILNNYTVKWLELNASEVALVRGLIQVSVFGMVLIIRNREIKIDIKEGRYIYIYMYRYRVSQKKGGIRKLGPKKRCS